MSVVAVALVPFLKYPATPPAVGSPDTIGSRTTEYFALLLVSVLAAIAAVVVARALLGRLNGVTAGLVAAGGFVVVVSVAGLVDGLRDQHTDVVVVLATLIALQGVALLWLGRGRRGCRRGRLRRRRGNLRNFRAQWAGLRQLGGPHPVGVRGDAGDGALPGPSARERSRDGRVATAVAARRCAGRSACG